MKNTFVYCPKSGDRVFAQKDCAEIVVIRYDNTCRHVVGGRHFSFNTVTPNAWCRDDAQRLVTQVIGHSGGVAWDDRGDLNLVIPEHKVAWALPLLRSALPMADWDLPALWRAGLASLNEQGNITIVESGAIDAGGIINTSEPILVIHTQATSGVDPGPTLLSGWGRPESEAIDVSTLQNKGWGVEELSGGIRGGLFDTAEAEGRDPAGLIPFLLEMLPVTTPSGDFRGYLPICNASENCSWVNSDGEGVCPIKGGPFPSCEGRGDEQACRQQAERRVCRPRVCRRPEQALDV